MNTFFKKLKNEARHIRMSTGEKARMRAALFGVPSSAQVVRTPYVFISPPALLRGRWVTRSFAAVALVAVLGGGTAFASEGSLPGQPLYGVKVGIVEPIKVALATTPAAKATVNAQIAQTRVEEAEALAQNGALDATTSQMLADDFDKHAQEAQTAQAQVAAENPDEGTKIEVAINSSLQAHAAILTQLAARDGERTRTLATFLADKVAARASSTAEVAIEDENKASGSDASTSERMISVTSAVRTDAEATSSDQEHKGGGRDFSNLAAALKDRAAQALEDAQSALADAQLSASTTVQIQAQLSALQGLMDDGSAALSTGDYAGAAADFKAVLSRALITQAYLSAGQRLNPDIVAPLLQIHDRNHGDGNSGGGDSINSHD